MPAHLIPPPHDGARDSALASDYQLPYHPLSRLRDVPNTLRTSGLSSPPTASAPSGVRRPASIAGARAHASPDAGRARLEPRVGFDFGNVRIHPDRNTVSAKTSGPADNASSLRPRDASPVAGVLRRACACGEGGGAPESCARCADEATLRREGAGAAESAAAPAIVHEALGSPGQPLGSSSRSFMEERFGFSFERVRVHDDARAAESARAVNALAYTVGDHVVFGRGQYDESSRAGRRLLAHELAHVVQQRATGPRRQASLVIGDAGDAAEREADRAAESVASDAGAIPPSLAAPAAGASAQRGGGTLQRQAETGRARAPEREATAEQSREPEKAEAQRARVEPTPLRVLVTGFNDWDDPDSKWECNKNPSCRLLVGGPLKVQPTSYDGALPPLLRAHTATLAGRPVEWTFETLPTTWGVAQSMSMTSYNVVINMGLGVYDGTLSLQLEDGAINLCSGRDALNEDPGASQLDPDATSGQVIRPDESTGVTKRILALAGQTHGGYTVTVKAARTDNDFICNETHYTAITALNESVISHGALEGVYFLHIPDPPGGDFAGLAQGAAGLIWSILNA